MKWKTFRTLWVLIAVAAVSFAYCATAGAGLPKYWNDVMADIHEEYYGRSASDPESAVYETLAVSWVASNIRDIRLMALESGYELTDAEYQYVQDESWKCATPGQVFTGWMNAMNTWAQGKNVGDLDEVLAVALLFTWLDAQCNHSLQGGAQ